ncbi:MAG: DUF427 domain-containing protein [Bacteroidales bacterium]|nr:DUF427 domain-containing protein [Bacteroidales bacterium]
MKAIWNNRVIAESDKTVVVENNHYFPPKSVNSGYLVSSDTVSTCPWKGEASYYDIIIDGRVNKDAAWTYPQPKEAAKEIKEHIAFWKGVEISES